MFEDKYDRIIYFDTETTGLSYKTNCITELAYAVVEKTNQFNISMIISKLTKINPMKQKQKK